MSESALTVVCDEPLYPVRCYSCKRVQATVRHNFAQAFARLRSQREDVTIQQAFDAAGVTCPRCRTLIVSIGPDPPAPTRDIQKESTQSASQVAQQQYFISLGRRKPADNEKPHFLKAI